MSETLTRTDGTAVPVMGNKVLVVNGDMHGRAFLDMYGNEITPGQMAWLNKAHADALNKRNRFWKIVQNNPK